MGYSGSTYLTNSNRLLTSGRELLLALGGPQASEGIAAVEEAAKPAPTASLGFKSVGPGSEANPDDALRAILFEAQSANVLIGAGLATEIPEPSRAPLSQALDQIEETQSAATTPAAGFKFAAGSSVKSADLASAKKTFRTDAQFALDQVVSGAAEIIQSAFEQLKKLDASKVIEAIENLGKPFQQAVDAGRLLKKGIEKLKNAINSLLDLIGSGSLDKVKDHVTEMWGKLTKGEYTNDILAWTFGVKDTGARIDALLLSDKLEIPDLDSASNSLRPLTVNYGGKVALIKGLLGVVVAISAGLALLHVVAPWLPLALGGAYVVLLGAGVVIGMNYAGSGGIIQWTKGVREIAAGLAPGTAA